jgi:lipoprotein-anchoring transpeptidase ErfK/SrfK
MLTKRQFLAGLAASTMPPSIGNTHKADDFVLPEEFLPREVRLKTKLEPGEIHVDPSGYALYWTMPKRKAIRYTIGIGRGNLYHPGEFFVGAKREWPSWRPTPDMMQRSPNSYTDFLEGGRYENGQPGGKHNPLGARALYLYTVTSRRDSYLRIHGTNAPRTIGIEVSNGCARLVNEQVALLYQQVPVGTRVVLYPKPGAGPAHKEIY